MLTEKEIAQIREEAILYCNKNHSGSDKTYKAAYNSYIAAVTKERERAKGLIEALKKIKDPISAMRENLKEGENLNRYESIRLSNNADYLKVIASTALKQYNNE